MVSRLNVCVYAFVFYVVFKYLGLHDILQVEDFVDGDRLKRIYAALCTGLSALTCVLFCDSINRDKKGTIRHVSFNV